jgi:hypothetical protein
VADVLVNIGKTAPTGRLIPGNGTPFDSSDPIQRAEARRLCFHSFRALQWLFH